MLILFSFFFSHLKTVLAQCSALVSCMTSSPERYLLENTYNYISSRQSPPVSADLEEKKLNIQKLLEMKQKNKLNVPLNEYLDKKRKNLQGNQLKQGPQAAPAMANRILNMPIANLQISPDFQAHQKKIWMALYLGGCGCGCGRRSYAEIRDKNKHV